VNLGGERKPLAGLWYVGLYSQQGDELTQQSSLANPLNRVAEYRIDVLEVCYESHLSQPIVQVITLKPIYSELQSEYIGKFVPFALFLNPNITELGCEFSL
jgi:hypothetical protein